MPINRDIPSAPRNLPVGRITFALLAIGLIAGGGCSAFQRTDPADDAPKTLLAWEVGPKKDKGEPSKKDKGEPPEKDKGEPPEKDGETDKVAKGGTSGSDRRTEEPLASDRPDFTEASSTVGKGRVQLESGYTFTGDRSGSEKTLSHSYPEALLRVGMIADWFEFRIGQNFGNTTGHTPQGVFHTGGSEDLDLGVKLGLTEQKGVFPELALVLQTLVPTGQREITTGRVLPGLNLLYGWDVIKDKVTLAGSTQANRAIADGHGYVEMAQSLSVGYSFTPKLASYTEWFAFFPAGATAPGITAQHYLDGGFTYKVTPNFQLDIRAGIGLSRRADDFFAGTGFAIRY